MCGHSHAWNLSAAINPGGGNLCMCVPRPSGHAAATTSCYDIVRRRMQGVQAGNFATTERPRHEVRQAEVDGKRVLLVAGENHHQGCGRAAAAQKT